jgi:hypothetical protein
MLTCILSGSALAEEDASPELSIRCVYDSFRTLTHATTLKIGERLYLENATGKQESATFLGYQEKAQQYLFVMDHEGEIKVVPSYRLIDSPDKAQKLLEISTQEGPTCAAHSTRNCLEFLELLGLLPHSKLRTLLLSSPEELFQVLKDNVSSEAWDRRYQELFPNHQASLITQTTPDAWLSRIKALGFTQADQRAALLNNAGLAVTITHDASEVEAHLRNGLPVILDVPIRVKESLKVHGGRLSDRDIPVRLMPTTPDDPYYFGWHSVLAVGLIEGGNQVGKKVLVLDSKWGQLNLWDLDAVERAIQGEHTMAASLIRPK